MPAKNVNTSRVTKMDSEPIPQTMVKSSESISRYNNPTNFMTIRPDSSVAGPVSTQGKMAGHKYVAACNMR